MYFSHDGDARRDVKLKRLRRKVGPEGYGLFWMILEEMSETDDLKLDADFETLAWDFHTEAETVQCVVCDFGLFEFDEDGLKFFSPSLIRRREMAQSRSNQLRERRRSAAQARWRPSNVVPTGSDLTDSKTADSEMNDSEAADSDLTESNNPIERNNRNDSNNPNLSNYLSCQNDQIVPGFSNELNCRDCQGDLIISPDSPFNISGMQNEISGMQNDANVMQTDANVMQIDANKNRNEKINKKEIKKKEREKKDGSSLSSEENFWLDSETAREIEASSFAAEVKAKLRDFVRSWNKDPTRTPLNDVSIQRHFQTLRSLSDDPTEQQNLIDLAISKGWKGFYAKYPAADWRNQPPRLEIPFAEAVQNEFQNLRFNDGSREFD